MEFLRMLIRAGVTTGMPHQTKRSVIATNYISVILTVAITVVWLFRLTVYARVGTVEINWLAGLIVFAFPVILNKFSLTTLSRISLCIGPVSFLWYSYISNMLTQEILELSHFDGLRIYILAVSFIPYLILDRRKPALLFVGIAPTLLSLIFFDYWLNLSGISAEDTRANTDGDYSLMWMRSLVGYAIISMGCFFFQGIIMYNDKLNETLLLKVRSNSEEIERQNRELIDQQAQLNELNRHLGELVDKKTRSIQLQNEMLIRYSYTNAHKVRGPVARILGLIQVSKMDNALDYPWLFHQVEFETRSIDEIVRGIATELDATVVSGAT